MEGDTMASFRESVEISARPDRVWKLVTDISRHPEFDAPSEVTAIEEGRLLEWVSHPPAKSEDHRGAGGICRWGFELTPAATGTRLEHHMTVIEARKVVYRVMGRPARFTAGGRTTLDDIRAAAEKTES